jgi:class 3 adenylate cyclase/tetratricopeptide (TPR) repeat protein
MRYSFGDYVLDTQRLDLHHAGQPIALRRKVFQVLVYLLAHRDRVVSKQELLAQLWPGQFVGEEALTSCVKTLRRALGERGRAPRFLRTLHGQGYRFVGAVEEWEHRPADDALQALPQRGGEAATLQVEGPSPALSSPLADLVSPPREALNGEHKQVTVLCGAVAEAPTLAPRLGPEAMYHLMHDVLALAQDTVQHYEGTLMQVSGDGFLALFGAPVAQEDHARRAVLAAFELRQRLHAPDAIRGQPDGVALRLGLHTGSVVVGPLAYEPQRPYTAAGETLHLATCLQQQAAPDTLLVSAATYALVQDEVQGEVCETLSLGRSSAPVPVYAIHGLLRRRGGIPRRGAWPLTRFVGRTQELAFLHERLAQAVSGQGQVIGIAGEPGLGKSRLLAEFIQSLHGQPVTCCEGHCLAYGSATPYLPVRDLLRQLWDLPDAAPATAITTTVHQRLHEAGLASEDETLLLLQLLDVPVDLAPVAALDPPMRKARTFALLWHVVRQACRRQPLMLVVENLHWIDPTSEAWLASLVERLGDTPVLLLATYRPGYQPPWLRHSAATQIALPRLSLRDSLVVLQSVPQAAQLPERLQQAIVAKAAGNPFFVEELTWAAVEHGDPAGTLAMPDTIEAVLAARLDRLPPEEKRLVQTAAVIGNEVPVPLLQAIAELPDAALQGAIAHLQAAEFLYETRLFPDPVYTFKHALTHEVAYSSLLQERRRALHSRIVEALEALLDDQRAEQADRLAHHALHGEVWDKALVFYRQAGDKAMAHSAFREAVACCELALTASQHLPEHRDTLAQAIDLRLALDEALLVLGESERRGFDYLRQAERLAETLGDQRRLGLICINMGHHFWRLGAHDDALAYAQRALTAASGDVALQAEAKGHLGTFYFALGDYRRATDVLRQSMAALEGGLRHMRPGCMISSVRTRYWLADCLGALGEFAEGLACGAEAVWIAEAAGHLCSAIYAQSRLGQVALRKGDLQQAIPLVERALAHCRAADISLFLDEIMANLGLAYALSGRLTEVLPLLEQVVVHEDSGRGGNATMTTLGQAYLLVGCMEDALQLAEHAMVLARGRKERGNQAGALWLLGEIAMDRHPPDTLRAETFYQQALFLAEALGMRPLQAHCHRSLGTLYVKTGRQEQARADLAAAIALYRAMDMTFWLPQTEADLAEVEGYRSSGDRRSLIASWPSSVSRS